MHIQFEMNNLLFLNIVTIYQLLIVGKLLISEFRIIIIYIVFILFLFYRINTCYS